MPTHSTPFGTVLVTGEDARAFMKMLEGGLPNPAAVESVGNGRRMVAEYARRGAVNITLKPRKPSGSSAPE